MTAVLLTRSPKRLTGTGWGVWDNHLQTWLATGHTHPGEAWKALLGLETPHPWELVVAEADDGGAPKPGPHDVVTHPCKTCDGDGECFNCGATCRDCDGTGEAA
jgi:hypothetical protein